VADAVSNPISALVSEARQHLNQEIEAQTLHLDELQNTFQEARQRLKQEISGYAERLENLQKSLEALREQQMRLQEATEQQLQQLAERSIGEARKRQNSLKEAVDERLNQVAQYEPPKPVAPLDKVLASVRNLITSTLPDQVLEVLTEEAEQMGVRAAVFDVRGKAAWGAAARGFEGLTDKYLRALIVPLNVDTPFRQVVETADHVEANAEQLKRNRNVLDKFKPGAEDQILLLPIRSAGAVSAIVYLDSGGKAVPLPVDGLKILAEFAGAQLDRLMALSGGIVAEPEKEAEPEAAPEEAAEPEAAQAAPAEIPPPMMQAAAAAAAAPAPVPAPPAPVAAPPESAPVGVSPAPAAPAPEAPKLSEEEEKYHKDAKRFAKLLVSEIELYSKAKVADGRKNRDLYKRLKSDIDRSRQTYQKRFSKPNQTDYFHEELVRLLANSDASLMGPEYPGPTA